MEFEPDLTKVIAWPAYLASGPDERELAEEYYRQASTYLESHDWCLEIAESYVGMFYPGIIGIFLFKIDPAEPADNWVWVVVGDLPPAYLTLDICSNPASALDGYIGAMEEWINAAAAGKSVADVIPVNVPATKEYADRLRWRLNFLNEKILPEYANDLDE